MSTLRIPVSLETDLPCRGYCDFQIADAVGNPPLERTSQLVSCSLCDPELNTEKRA